MSIISMENVSKCFGDLQALDSINLEVQAGEVISLIGPSGSGKSTLLRSVNRLEQIDEGRIEIEGVCVTDAQTDPGEVRRASMKLGMVFQHFHLFPHKTVLENVMEGPLVVKKIDKAAAREKAEALLEQVGLAEKRDSYPSRISGGQKQRVAIARALAMDPDILLCDEPTSALDPELVGEVLAVLRDLADEKMTMLIVTHEMSFARDICDRAVFMDQGRILADQSPEQLFHSSDHPRIVSFLERFSS